MRPGTVLRCLAPVAAVLLVALLDVVAGARSWSVPVTGLLDEPAHLATAWVVLAAAAPRRTPPWFWATALGAAVAIDVDHIPLYLTHGAFAVGGGRPPTHCLLLAVVLGGLGSWPRLRWATGAAVGVLLHFLRDVATGPGVALWWPLSDHAVLLPHRWYLALLGALALVAAGRRLLHPGPVSTKLYGPTPFRGDVRHRPRRPRSTAPTGPGEDR